MVPLAASGMFSLFFTSFTAILQVFFLCGLGAALAHPRVNVLTKDARQYLNKLVFIVFLPSLVFVKLGQAVTFSKVIEWWFLPANVLIICTLGALMGCLLNYACKTPSKFRPLIIACCCMGNLANLPLVLVEAVCRDENSPFAFATPAECSAKGLAYVSYGMWMSVVVMWTFIYNLMKPSGRHVSNSLAYERLSSLEVELGAASALSPNEKSKRANILAGMAPDSGADEKTFDSQTLDANDKDTSASILQELTPASCKIAVDSPEAAEQAPPDVDPIHRALGDCEDDSMQEGAFSHSTKAAVWDFLSNCRIGDIFTPPTTSAIVALAIGATPFLKRLFFDSGAPLKIVTNSLNILGTAMVPCMMLVLGGSLAEGPGKGQLSTRMLVGVSVVRLAFLPTLGIAVVQLADWAGFLPPGDPLFRFTLMLQFAMPTAMNLGTVAALHGVCEREASLILFWQYVLASLSMMIFIVVFLAVVL